MGGNIDHEVDKGNDPCVFWLSGQNIHRIGSSIPSNSDTPQLVQLYVNDTKEEVENRINVITSTNKDIGLHLVIVSNLFEIYNNVLVQACGMTRVWNVLVHSNWCMIVQEWTCL